MLERKLREGEIGIALIVIIIAAVAIAVAIVLTISVIKKYTTTIIIIATT